MRLDSKARFRVLPERIRSVAIAGSRDLYEYLGEMEVELCKVLGYLELLCSFIRMYKF